MTLFDNNNHNDMTLGLLAILNQTGAYIFTKDIHGRYTYFNQKVQELFADTEENILGQDDSRFFDLERTFALKLNDRRVLEQGETIESEEVNIVKATGETRTYWTIKKPLYNRSGDIIGLCGVSSDITGRKDLENALIKSETQLRLSQLVAGIGSWETDLTTNKQIWSENCHALLGQPAVRERTWEDFLTIVHPEDRARIVAATQTHLAQHTPYDVEYRILTADGERWLRSIGKAERNPEGKPVVMRGIVQDVTERKLAETQLTQSLSLLQATIEATHDAILVVDLNNKWVLHNQRFLALWQIPDEIVARNDDSAALDFVLDQLIDAEAFLQKVLQLYETPEASSFDVLKFKSGKVIERYSIPQRVNGETVGRVWNFRDVTEQEQAKQAYKREAEKNLAILHNASDGIHILDYDGYVIEASNSFCAMLGYERDQIIGMHVSQWDVHYIGSQCLQVLRQQFANPYRSQFETQHRRKDGTTFDVEVSGYALKLDGKPVLFNSARDISLRIRIEAAMRQKARYHRALLDNFPFAVWLKDKDSRFLAVNAGFAKVFGAKSPDALIGKNDHDIAPAQLAEGYRADDCQVMTSRQKTYREEQILTDGALKWFETYKAPVIDENDQLLGTVGFARDISSRKQDEQKLHLAASVFSHTREAIMLTDPDGIIMEVNAAFTRITGYSREEVVGQTPRILRSEQHSEEFYALLWRSLLDSGFWKGEIWNRRKNGEMYPEQLTINAVRDAQEHIQHYVALFSDITEQKQYQQHLEHAAHFDALTNLPNRVLLADRLHIAMSQAKRHGQLLAVAYLDLDGFKTINDHYGHASGDHLLLKLTERMKHALRDTDTLSRLGGDEFVAVLTDLDHSNACLPLLNRLLEAASEPIKKGAQTLQVSVSIGVTFYPQTEAVDADQLLRQSDQAMYQAKLTGKNRYHLFDAERDHSIRSQHQMLNQLAQALSNQEFILYYQPKVNLRTHTVIGAEALLRWQHPERGLLLPNEFLPALAGHPLAIELGEWVIRSALLQMEQWQALGFEIPVSVNICDFQLQQENFAERLAATLSQHPRIEADQLELEILETSIPANIEQTKKIIDSCKQLGVRFALDDFGSGYSSLTYFKQFPVTQVKIGQNFVIGMLEDPDDLTLLMGIISLAQAFNRSVIAEGVETREHGEALLRLGCEQMQGYAIARPMPANKIPIWFREWHSDTSWDGLSLFKQSQLPLVFASSYHRAWLKALTDYLTNQRDIPPDLNPDQCRLGLWLANEGSAKFSDQAAFITLQQLHQQTHALATNLCSVHMSDPSQPMLAGIAELKNVYEQILSCLKNLYDCS